MGLGSAPGDRPGVVGESPIRRRSSDPRRPRAVRVWPRGQGRSVGRGPCRPAIEPRQSHGSGCRRCYQSGRPHERGRQREPLVDPAWSETLACTHAPGTGTGRSPARPQALGPSGPHREGEEPSPMMHGRKKSDLARGAAKPANNDGRPSAELVERRAGAEGNAGQDRTRRAQDRVSVSQGLDRVRHVARQRKKERFTALLHHVTPNRLRTAFFALRRQAAPGVDGLTWQAYEADLDRRIEGLHERVHRGAYRALPARRGFIPKADGSQRLNRAGFLGGVLAWITRLGAPPSDRNSAPRLRPAAGCRWARAAGGGETSPPTQAWRTQPPQRTATARVGGSPRPCRGR